jgi:RHS repeat-associated protein
MEKDDEVKGSGNSYDFGARMYDSRVGRWLSRDPLENKLPDQTPYNYALNSPIMVNDPNGEWPKVKITSERTGYTIQRLYGVSASTLQIDVPAVVVATYKAVIYDVAKDGTETVMGYFNVTRDGWYSRGKDDNGVYQLLNRAFRPADPEKNLYGAEWLPSYPCCDIDAFRLQRFGENELPAKPLANQTRLDGTPIDDARPDPNVATDVLIHISGVYETYAGWDKLGGSYGCFGFIPADDIYSTPELAKQASVNDVYDDVPSNDAWDNVANSIINLLGTAGKMQVLVEPRDESKNYVPTEVFIE